MVDDILSLSLLSGPFGWLFLPASSTTPLAHSSKTQETHPKQTEKHEVTVDMFKKICKMFGRWYFFGKNDRC